MTIDGRFSAEQGLAAALAYPLTLTDPDSGCTRTILLQPGHIDWLARLVRDELTTCREAHAGRSGACEHCGALPAKDDDADQPRVTSDARARRAAVPRR